MKRFECAYHSLYDCRQLSDGPVSLLLKLIKLSLGITDKEGEWLDEDKLPGLGWRSV